MWPMAISRSVIHGLMSRQAQRRLETWQPRTASRERGATMVEFALFFIVFLAVTLGIMEFGRAVWTYTTLAHAARQGARYAMVHGESNPVSNDQVRDVVAKNAVGLDKSIIVVRTSWLPDNSSGSRVEVQVEYPFRFVTAPLLLSDNALLLRSTSRVIVW
jgi:Flp pilus assembly protein TadG